MPFPLGSCSLFRFKEGKKSGLVSGARIPLYRTWIKILGSLHTELWGQVSVLPWDWCETILWRVDLNSHKVHKVQ